MILDTSVTDFGYSTENLSPQWGYPYRYTTTGQMGFDEYLWFWARIVNLPAQPFFSVGAGIGTGVAEVIHLSTTSFGRRDA